MTGPEQPLALAPLMADQLQRWLDSERGARDRSDHTIKAYQGDLLAFLSFLGRHQGGPALPATLGSLTQTDMRAFAASERARGLGARSLARRLSAVRWNVASRIVIAWVVTLPAAGAVAGLLSWAVTALV